MYDAAIVQMQKQQDNKNVMKLGSEVHQMHDITGIGSIALAQGRFSKYQLHGG